MAGGCKQCNRKHNTLLHEEHEFKPVSEISDKEQVIDKAQNSCSVTSINATTLDLSTSYSVTTVKFQTTHQVLLATAYVIIQGIPF